ncbi:MAG: CYCXC family (seleno)protein, partial [Candidatus Acidiferrales bacterium]
MKTGDGRKNCGMMMGAAVLLALSVAAVPLMRAQQAAPTTRDIPAYHSAAPKGALPATLPANSFSDPLTKKAYGVAAKLKPVLYQLPCYCRCDRAAGHTSLLSCYGDMHGSECEICKKEVFYAYEQSRKGRTARQIRTGIIHGDWGKVDLSR